MDEAKVRGILPDEPEEEREELTEEERELDESEDGFPEESGDMRDGMSIMLNDGEHRLTREEVEKYVRMGMEREYEDPVMIKLDYLAASEGISREEYVDRQLNLGEESALESLVERYGDDDEAVSELLEYKKQKNKRLYDELSARRKKEAEEKTESEHSRIAREYAELAEEFPELKGKSFGELPAEVKKSGFKGEKLINAYLRFKHNEEKKIKSALEEKRTADESSAGSMQTVPYDGKGEAERRYLNALWRK